MSDPGFWMLVLATLAAGVVVGIVGTLLYLADHESQELPYEQAKRCWKHLSG